MFAFESLGIGDGEDFLHVKPAVVYRFLCLGFVLFDAAQAGSVDGEFQYAVYSPGDPFRLVVAAFLFLSGAVVGEVVAATPSP